MTIIQRTGHPRRRDWWRYRCDRCRETFWGPKFTGSHPEAVDHHCFDCGERPARTGVGNPHVGTNTIDADPDSYARSDAMDDPR